MAVAKKTASKPRRVADGAYRFEPVRLESLFAVLDAVAWLDAPSSSSVAQFAGIDPRTAGKVLKNAVQIGMLEPIAGGYGLRIAYPYKGSKEQKEAVVKEALVRLPLLTGLRQFVKLGDTVEVALRKAATVAGIAPFSPNDLNPLVDWANSLGALNADLLAEDLVDEAEQKKERRHKGSGARPMAFMSHSSVDKPFIRQLAADLTANDVDVWLDEQRIRVGESIPERIAQGLAESDYFLIAVSEASAASEWVKKELNNALITEVQRRKVHVLPLRLDKTKLPPAISDKKYADFSESYKSGLEEILRILKGDEDGGG